MPRCSVEEGDFLGWRAAYLRNDLITLVAVPDVGGRIMVYDLGPYPYLYVDRGLAGRLFSPEENYGDGSLAAWKNYGGDKTWPAPQGWERDDQWHGPPDPVLDSGRYRLDGLAADEATATVSMTSPETSPTGVQISRRATIQADSARVTLDLSFRNVSARPVRWSVWDVVQLRAERRAGGGLAHEPGCVVSAPLNPDSRFAQGFQVMFGEQDNPQWRADRSSGLFVGEYRWEIGKVGLDSRAGWAAFANTAAGYAFAARFAVFPDEEYPDDGASVEFWTVGRGRVANLDYEHSDVYLMECEVLGPLRRIGPGQEAGLSIEWGACRCPGPVVDVTEAGCAGEKLRAERRGEQVRFRGAFGVFDRGELDLVWLDEAGEALDRVLLLPVDPLHALLIDEVHAAPTAAREMALAVRVGDRSRTLARAALR